MLPGWSVSSHDMADGTPVWTRNRNRAAPVRTLHQNLLGWMEPFMRGGGCPPSPHYVTPPCPSNHSSQSQTAECDLLLRSRAWETKISLLITISWRIASSTPLYRRNYSQSTPANALIALRHIPFFNATRRTNSSQIAIDKACIVSSLIPPSTPSCTSSLLAPKYSSIPNFDSADSTACVSVSALLKPVALLGVTYFQP